MRIFALSILSLILTNCASYTDEIRDVRSDFINGRNQSALDRLEKSSLKNSNTNRLLYHMEKAMIMDRLGDLKNSRSLLVQADKIADELYTTSISKTAATFLVNESVADYEGEDFEKVAIHSVLALSFLEEGKLNEAEVEARKINTKLAEITQKYDPKYAHYKEDAFARFLAGLIHEAQKNWDDALIDYKKALSLYTSPNYSQFYEGSVPESLVTSLYGVALRRQRSDIIKDLKTRFPKILDAYDDELKSQRKSGDVIVVHEAGHIVVKKAKDFVLPISNQIVRFSFPVIEKRSVDYVNTQSGVSVSGHNYPAANVTNLNAIAYQVLEDRRGRLIAKSIARLIAKGALTEQAHRQFGLLGGLAVNIFSAVTETADTRGWATLPQAFYVNRVRLKPGHHEIEIKTAGRTSQMLEMDIKDGDLHLVRSKT